MKFHLGEAWGLRPKPSRFVSAQLQCLPVGTPEFQQPDCGPSRAAGEIVKAQPIKDRFGSRLCENPRNWYPILSRAGRIVVT
jgi:hypothetical protein